MDPWWYIFYILLESALYVCISECHPQLSPKKLTPLLSVNCQHHPGLPGQSNSSTSKYHTHVGSFNKPSSKNFTLHSVAFSLVSLHSTNTYLHARLLHLLAYHAQDQTYLLLLQCCFSSCVSFLSEWDHLPHSHLSQGPGSHL